MDENSNKNGTDSNEYDMPVPILLGAFIGSDPMNNTAVSLALGEGLDSTDEEEKNAFKEVEETHRD